ncbi:hypothetical protein Trydic_g14578, partial [Trypoxylus dichotomus]
MVEHFSKYSFTEPITEEEKEMKREEFARQQQIAIIKKQLRAHELKITMVAKHFDICFSRILKVQQNYGILEIPVTDLNFESSRSRQQESNEQNIYGMTPAQVAWGKLTRSRYFKEENVFLKPRNRKKVGTINPIDVVKEEPENDTSNSETKEEECQAYTEAGKGRDEQKDDVKDEAENSSMAINRKETSSVTSKGSISKSTSTVQNKNQIGCKSSCSALSKGSTITINSNPPPIRVRTVSRISTPSASKVLPTPRNISIVPKGAPVVDSSCRNNNDPTEAAEVVGSRTNPSYTQIHRIK